MKTMKKLGISVLSLIAACCVFAGCNQGNTDSESSSSSNDSTIVGGGSSDSTVEKLNGEAFDKQTTYYQNDVVKFPTEISVDGQMVRVTPCLLFPGGNMVMATDVRLSEIGAYTLSYLSTTNSVVETHSFNVYKATFTMTSEKSSFNIGRVSDYSNYDSTDKGAIVKLMNGDVLEYSEIIDVSDNTKNKPLLSLKVLPAEGAGEVRTIVFSLTDIYNPENVLTFTIARSNPYPEYVMLMVNAPNQKPSGLESWYYDEGFTYEGQYYRYHTGDGYGTYLTYSMDGASSGMMDISMDYAEKRVYFNKNLCVDLDDPILFSSLWEGFSADKCFFSMYAKDYSRNEFNFLLTNLDGVQEFSPYSVDTDAPEISVEQDLQGVYGVVGMGFCIPDATANDVIEGACDVQVGVYRNYGTSSQTKLYVDGNSFVPSSTGKYSIVYTSTDNSGNKAVKKFDIDVKNASTPLVSIEALRNGDDAGVQGAIVHLAGYNVENNNGAAKVDIVATCGDVEYVVDVDTLAFRPFYAGEYTITYTVKDYIAEAQASYTLNVAKTEQSIFVDVPMIPKYVIANATYETPKLSGYRFENGKPIVADAEVYISATQSLEGATLISDDTYAYAGAAGKCWFAYKLDDTIEWFETEVVDVGCGTNQIKIYDYFIGKNGTTITSTATNTYTDYQLVGVDGEATIEFVNAVQVFNFSTELTIPTNRQYNRLYLTLEDSYQANDARVTITMEIANNGSIKFYDAANNSCILNKVVGNALSISFVAETGKISFTCGTTATLTLQNNIQFTGDKAYFSLSANADAVDLRIFSVNNQLISSQKKDLVFPQYTYSSQFGRFDKGTVVNLDGVKAADTLSPYVTVVMSVKTAEGKYMTAVDGTLLDETADFTKDYQMKLDEYTYYYVSYEISDGRNKTVYQYTFYVTDNIRPEIVIGDHKTEYKVGDTVVVGDYIVSDDVTKAEDCIVYITITMPDNRTAALKGNSFVANIAGKYTVYYYVQDEAGNVTLTSYAVMVS